MKCQGLYFLFLAQGAVWDKEGLTNSRSLALVCRRVLKRNLRVWIKQLFKNVISKENGRRGGGGGEILFFSRDLRFDICNEWILPPHHPHALIVNWYKTVQFNNQQNLLLPKTEYILYCDQTKVKKINLSLFTPLNLNISRGVLRGPPLLCYWLTSVEINKHKIFDTK